MRDKLDSQIVVRLPLNLRKLMDKAAEKDRRPVTQWLRILIEKHFEGAAK